MKRILLSLFFIITFLLLISSPVEARQGWPSPGVNCGVAYDPLRDYKHSQAGTPLSTSATPDLAVDTQFACCEGLLTEDDVKVFGRVVSQNVTSLPSNSTSESRLSDTIPNALTIVPGLGVTKLVLSTGEKIYDGITSIPLRTLTAISDVVTDNILDWPNSIIPSHPNIFPTVKTTLKAYNGSGKCLPGGIAGYDSNNACYCKVQTSLPSLAKFCNNIEKNNIGEQTACLSCLGFSRNETTGELTQNAKVKQPGIWTAIGCIPADFRVFIEQTVFGLAIGFVGLVSLLCIIYSSFLLQTSAGDPERIKKAQELLTSCIAGLMMVIFSVFILRLIGVSILRIPGFS